jgi:hypothetical protein
MKLYKIKANEDTFKFDTLEFTDDLKLTENSKNTLVEYLTTLIEEISFKDDSEFITKITELLKVHDDNIGNTIDVYTTNKKIYQMCYLEYSKEGINFLGTIMNTKRKIINGDIYVYANSLLTTKITDKTKTLEYIKQDTLTMDELVEIILSNYYFKGLCFEGDKYSKYIFDNNLKIVAPTNLKDIQLNELSFRRSDLLNFTIDVFSDEKGDLGKTKYNKILGLFYDTVFFNRIFIANNTENDKRYDSILDDYIGKIIGIYNKYLCDDKEIIVPKDLKFYDYQSNDKYTNKYIIFDNLYEKIL